ncbi:endonuclease/exonuclease/phosphatase family protein [Myxococcota bacterium]|nr:endonuclease/exonuclease/phosphatase family protein [Myxococcota bacterium]MBU1534602.1 endonuclease/exonuclease/phosphatase family protein [Myxococcota bacterium]
MLLFSSRSATIIPPKNTITGNLTLISWNVNFGIQSDASMVKTMGKIPCDAVFLQETTPLWEAAIKRNLSTLFPHMRFIHFQGAGGLAVLSKHPINQLATILPPPRGWFPAMAVTLQVGKTPVQVLNVHLHPPFNNRGSVVKGYFTSKSIRLREIEKYYKSLTEKLPTIVVGDFNEEKSGSAVSFLRKKGFSTSLNSQNTWRWKTSFYLTLRSQLDHVLYRGKIALKDSRVIKTGQSDHLPVVASFYLLK